MGCAASCVRGGGWRYTNQSCVHVLLALSEPQVGAHRRGGRRHHVRHRLRHRLDSRHVAALSGNNSRSNCRSSASLPSNLRRLDGRHSQALERPLLVLGLRLGQAVRVDARLGRRKGGRSCSCGGGGNSGWRRRRARPLGGSGRGWCCAAGRTRGRVTGFFALRGGGCPRHARPALRLHALCVQRRQRHKCVSPMAQHRSQSAAHSKGVPSVCLARNQARLFLPAQGPQARNNPRCDARPARLHPYARPVSPETHGPRHTCHVSSCSAPTTPDGTAATAPWGTAAGRCPVPAASSSSSVSDSVLLRLPPLRWVGGTLAFF